MVVPIDDSIAYRCQSEIKPVADAFDDIKMIIILIISLLLLSG